MWNGKRFKGSEHRVRHDLLKVKGKSRWFSAERLCPAVPSFISVTDSDSVLIMLLLRGPLNHVISSTSGSRRAVTRWALWISLKRLVKAPRHSEQLRMHRPGSTKTCCESGPVHRHVFPRRLSNVSELQMSGWDCESMLRSKREEDGVRRRSLGNPSTSWSVLPCVKFLCVCVAFQ